MNRVFKEGEYTTPLTPKELCIAANIITSNYPFKESDFMGENSRIQGSGHCDCGGNGDFELLAANDPDVIEGGKRYMHCRKCGGWSHL